MRKFSENIKQCNSCKIRIPTSRMKKSGNVWKCFECLEKIYVNCSHCGTKFKRRPPAINKVGRGCCSTKCGYAIRRKYYKYTCEICKKKFVNNINYDLAKKLKKFRFCSKKCTGVYKTGRKLPKLAGNKSIFWKGGVTPINEKIRNSSEYKNWRRYIFKRDNYTCIWCGKKDRTIQADHIKPFSLFPDLRFEIDNGRTLCIECHKTTDTYGRKSFR